MFKVYSKTQDHYSLCFYCKVWMYLTCQQQQNPESKLHLISLNQHVFYSSEKWEVNVKFLKLTLAIQAFTVRDKCWHSVNLSYCKLIYLHTGQSHVNYIHIEYFRCKISFGLAVSDQRKFPKSTFHLQPCIHKPVIYLRWSILQK